jgi:YHS domain-containing protein
MRQFTKIRRPLLLTLVSLSVAFQAVGPRFLAAQSVGQEVVAQTMMDSKTTRHPVYYTEKGVALDGQDVVAYFTKSAVVEGNQQFSLKWGGTTWLFSSAQNRDLFAKNPIKYAPQYGGYCAKAAASGVLATTVPTAWNIREGKLYLNYSAAAQQEWKQDTATKIAQADKNWPKILNNDTLKQ